MKEATRLCNCLHHNCIIYVWPQSVPCLSFSETWWCHVWRRNRMTNGTDSMEMEILMVTELKGSAQIICVPERKWCVQFCPGAYSLKSSGCIRGILYALLGRKSILRIFLDVKKQITQMIPSPFVLVWTVYVILNLF